MTDWNEFGTVGNAVNSYWSGAARTLQEMGEKVASTAVSRFGIGATIVMGLPQLGSDFANGVKTGDYSAAITDGQNLGISIGGSIGGELALGAFGGAIGGPPGAVIGALVGAFLGAEYTDDLLNFLMEQQYTQKKWGLDWDFRAGDSDPYQRMDPEYGNVYSGYTGPGTGFDSPRELPPSPEQPQSSNWDDGTQSGDTSETSSGPGTGATGNAQDHDSGTGEAGNPSVGSDLNSPVIIDLSQTSNPNDQAGDGLTFLGLYNSPVFYNSDNDAFLERTAWVGPNEGIVVHVEELVDTNGDGKLSSAEIALTKRFGGTTDLEALWKAEAAIAGANQELHVLTAAEAEVLGLKIWQDADVDGVLDAGEMKSFADAGISNIDMTESNLADLANEGDGLKANQIVEARFSDGSVIFGTANVRLSNGKETTAYDVGFAYKAAGMKEIKEAEGYTTEIRLQRQSGGGDWNYLTTTSTAAVDWDFDTAGRSGYYGGTGTGLGDKMVYSGAFSRSFSGGAGNDTLIGGAGDDFLIGGIGADRLSGRGGNDVLYVDAQDVAGGLVDGGEGFDVVKVNSAAGVTLNMSVTNAEAFYGSSGNDVVSAGGRMIGVIMSGEGGNDLFTGGADSDILIGGEGNDSLNGGDKHDQLIGGKGVDSLYGGTGDDYIVADEHDNFAHVKGEGGFDILIIDDSVDDNVAFSQQLNLIAMGFEAAVGGNGNDVFNVSSVTDDTFLVGMGGNDTLTTGSGDDMLAGGKGNDLLNGGHGGDLYVFNREDGQDAVQEFVGTNANGGLDGIAFGTDIRVDDLEFSLVNGTDLLISLRQQDGTALTGDTIRINGWSAVNTQVELLAFSNGTMLDIGGARFSSGSASAGLDIIDAGTGNNTIDAMDGNDIVLGRAGNDNIYGARGHDYLDGGLGDDILFGNEDDDSLMGGQGDGRDRLEGGDGDDYLDGEGGADTLTGGRGKDELWGGAGSDDLIGDQGDDILVGGTGYDKLVGGLGDDVYFFERKDGHETIYDEGSDDDFNLETIGYQTSSDGQPNYSMPITKKVYHETYADDRVGDRIAFGYDIKLTDLAFDVNNDGDLRIGVSRAGLIPNDITNLADLITVKNWTNENRRVERLNFMDGAVLYVEGIDGASSGSNASNVLDGGNNDNLLTGGGNADTIRGHDGNDVIMGGDGWDDLRGQNGNDVVFGGKGNDNIKGGDGNDRLFGGEGNDDISGHGEENSQDSGRDDYIVGGMGDDTLRGGVGNDTYFFSFGDGTDTITEEAGSWPNLDNDQRENTIAFGAGIWFSDLKVTNVGDAISMQIVPLNRPTDAVTTIKMTNFAIRQLEFANGYFAHFGDVHDGQWGSDAVDVFNYASNNKSGAWLNGNGGNDILKGGGGRDILIGGEEDDQLEGGENSDYYVFNAFDGRDTLRDSGGVSDSIAFGPGLTLFDLSLKSYNGDLVVSIRDDDRQDFSPLNSEHSITVKNWDNQGPDARIEWFDFTIGNSFKIGEISRALFKGANNDDVNGNATAEWIEGGTGGDTIDAGGGNDIVFGRDGWDNLAGGDKNDQLYGEGGNDDLRGNDGSDQLFGGTGNDGLIDNNGSDYLYGGDGDDKLSGGKGSNLLHGGKGDDIIYRGGYMKATTTTTTHFGETTTTTSFDPTQGSPVRKLGDEAVTVIAFGRGDGHDRVIVENPNDDELTGKHDHIDLIGVSMEEVWFEKNEDNLILRILGTDDSMVFVDFYKSSNHKFDRINADGMWLDGSEVEDLRFKMREYTPNVGNNAGGVTSSELSDGLLELIHDKWDRAPDYAA